MSSPSHVRFLRQRYEVIRATDPGTDVSAEEQHRYWRAHDRAKREYALADWKWESLVLRVLIAASGVLGLASFLVPALLPLAVLEMTLAIWRCYVIFTRHAPGGD